MITLWDVLWVSCAVVLYGIITVGGSLAMVWWQSRHPWDEEMI
jgi:hypothetical protein